MGVWCRVREKGMAATIFFLFAWIIPAAIIPLAYPVASVIHYNMVIYPPVHNTIPGGNFVTEPSVGGSQTKIIPGVALTNALIEIIEQSMLVDWQPNDITGYPTTWLDNPINFQMGELEALRDVITVIRQKVAQESRNASEVNPHLTNAMNALSNDASKWIFRSFESWLEVAVHEIKAYRDELQSGEAHFFPRADNLIALLDVLMTRLGTEMGRLARAPHVNLPAFSVLVVGEQTPWMGIDDNFYHAQGALFVISKVFRTATTEFKSIIAVKGAEDFGAKVTNELKPYFFTTDPLLVLNCGPLAVCASNSYELLAPIGNTQNHMREFVKALNN